MLGNYMQVSGDNMNQVSSNHHSKS